MTTQTDRELLELAAKAAGHTIADWVETRAGVRPNLHDMHAPGRWLWDPLTDDGEALRLAVNLRININWRSNVNGDFVYANHEPEQDEGNPDAATRRAIVRAAADIGKAMP